MHGQLVVTPFPVDMVLVNGVELTESYFEGIACWTYVSRFEYIRIKGKVFCETVESPG